MNRLLNRIAFSAGGAIASAALLAGCGGGGGTAASPPMTTPTTTPSSYAGPFSAVSFSIRIPAPGPSGSSSARRPKFVSPSTASVSFVLNSASAMTAGQVTAYNATGFGTFNVTPGSGPCVASGGGFVCTENVNLPPGSDNVTINATEGASGTGPLLSTVTQTLVVNTAQNNSFNVVLQGQVASVTVTGAALSANDTSHATTGEVLTVNAADSAGNIITNAPNSANYNNPITLTDNDATGQTKLVVNGGTPGSSVVVNNPSDVVTLTYTGQAANTFTISDSGAGFSGFGTISTNVDDVTFTGTTLDDDAHGGISSDTNFGQQTLFFFAASGTQNVTAAELGFTNAPFSQQFDMTLSAGCSGIATSSASPATTFTITAAGGTGVCSARVKEHGTGYPITQHTANAAGSPTHDGTFWISVTTAGVTVNGHRQASHQ
jgi:hypothetical protein